MKKRQANFEVLRVVAMAMIVAMHFMHNGSILQPLTGNMTVVNSLAWLLESFCIVAANCYVLIAGYFLVEAEWKLKKLVMLVAQVLFYSIFIPLICLITGTSDVGSWSVYEWLTAVLPLQSDHYWFATAYILMFALCPVLAAGVKQLTKRQLETVIAVLLIYFCLFKTICPLQLANDRFCYDYPWFICLFLIAAYIRLYYHKESGLQTFGFSLHLSGKKGMLGYVVLTVIIFVFSICLGLLNRKIAILDHYMNMVYSYNHILTLLSSLSLFFAFLHWEPKENGFVRGICKIAPYTFAVYLIHENIAVRHLWTGWLFANRVQNSLLFIPCMLIAIIVVFAVGVLVDIIRKKIFTILFK